MSRTSRGHAEATGEISDEPRRPTKPNDSPDELEVTRMEEVEMSLSKASRGVQEGPGDGDDEERRSGVPDEPPDEPYGEPRNPEGVKVEPGGKAGKVERNGCAAHDDADAEVDGEVAETRRDTEVEVESVETRREASVEAEEWSASTHERSTATDEENDQRNETNVDDVPSTPPEPPPLLNSPYQPVKQHDEPPSVELEGERRSCASCDDGPTSDVTDAWRASEGVEDDGTRPRKLWKTSERERKRLRPKDEEDSPKEGALDELDAPGDEADASTASEDVEADGNQPTKLWNALEQVSERSKRKLGEDSPGRPGEEPEEPGGETAVQDDAHTYQGSPRGVTSDAGGGTNVPSRDRPPGGHLGDQEESRGVEIVRDRANIVDRAGYYGNHPGSEENEHDGGTDARTRDRGPGGHRGKQGESGDIDGDRERQSDGERDEMDGR